MSVKLSDVEVENLISLTKLVESRVTDIRGYLSKEFGTPVFKISSIHFADGTHCWVEGEHDMPYVPSNGPWGNPELVLRNMDSETLADLHKQQEQAHE